MRVIFPERTRAVGSFVSYTHLLLRIQRMLRLLEVFILQSQAFGIGLDRLDGSGNLAGPRFLIELAQFPDCRRARARVVVRETRVPPDAGVHGIRQVQTV